MYKPKSLLLDKCLNGTKYNLLICNYNIIPQKTDFVNLLLTFLCYYHTAIIITAKAPFMVNLYELHEDSQVRKVDIGNILNSEEKILLFFPPQSGLETELKTFISNEKTSYGASEFMDNMSSYMVIVKKYIEADGTNEELDNTRILGIGHTDTKYFDYTRLLTEKYHEDTNVSSILIPEFSKFVDQHKYLVNNPERAPVGSLIRKFEDSIESYGFPDTEAQKADVSEKEPHLDLAESLFIKLVVGKDGNRISTEDAGRNISKVVIWAHSAGTIKVCITCNFLKDKMSEIGYSAEETKKILSNVKFIFTGATIQTQKNDSLLFSGISIEDENDIVMDSYHSHHSNLPREKTGKCRLIKESDSMIRLITINPDRFYFYTKDKMLGYRDGTFHSITSYISNKKEGNNVPVSIFENALKNFLEGKQGSLEECMIRKDPAKIINEGMDTEFKKSFEGNFPSVRRINEMEIKRLVLGLTKQID